MLSNENDMSSETTFAYAKSLNVRELLLSIEEVRAEQPTAKVWAPRPFKGIVDSFVSATVLKLKHNVVEDKDVEDTCFGYIENGVCKKCKEHTPGVVVYSIEIMMRDFNDPTKTVFFTGGQTAGIGLFGMSAQSFNALPPAEQSERMWNVVEQPFVFKVVHDYRPKDNHIHTTMFNVNPLPLRLLPDVD